MREAIRAALLASTLAGLAVPATAQDAAGWYALEVPGGRTTLRSLGIPDDRERSAVMVELLRRFLFATTPQTALESSLRQIPASSGGGLILPLPMAPARWSAIVFDKAIPPSRLFAEILLDPSARLLFHGLAGLDQSTRLWIEQEDELLRRLYRDPDALKSFALFAPALQVARGRIEIAGPSAAELRWSSILDAKPDQPARFVSRLFEDRDGRTAGLFATIAFADDARRGFLLGASAPRFERLVESFAQCYPADANDYPLALRSYDAALLLMELPLTATGTVAGPSTQRFWQGVFDVDTLSPAVAGAGLAGGEALDPAWVVDRLCGSSAHDRGVAFATMLAGPRMFTDLATSHWPDAVLALRVRRLFPSVFMAMEGAGLRNPAVIAAVGRHALQLDRLTGMDSAATALGQFQGALALTLNARGAGIFDIPDAEALLMSLSAVPFARQRYDGSIANWIKREWLPAAARALNVASGLPAEQLVALALAGPSPAPPSLVHWEGVDYVVDFPAATRRRLREVRARQGGQTLDVAFRSEAGDAQLAQVLVSWAYAVHAGAADGGALVGGDSSARHDLGLRAVNRTRFEQRWEVAGKVGERGAIAGSYLGLVSPLASWSLRRLASDRIPPPPTISDNDLSSLFLTVALSDPAALTNAGMHRIADAIAGGSRRIAQAGTDVDRLSEAARAAAMSPWRRAALPWIVVEERERLAEQFTLSQRARLGGLGSTDTAAWGTAALMTGCLCLRMPPARIPELTFGRPADGIVAVQSADLMLRIAVILSDLKMPASLASPVLSYAMRDFVDAVQPSHPADIDAFSRQAARLDQAAVEDYLGAIAAVGALRPANPQ